jgi:hypothetical protein
MGCPRLPLRDTIFAVTYKTYSMLSSRRFASDMCDALAKGYVSRSVHFNSIFDYLQMESLTPYLKQMIAESARPLQSIETDFAVDSSGFSTTNYDAGSMSRTATTRTGMTGSRCTLCAA